MASSRATTVLAALAMLAMSAACAAPRGDAFAMPPAERGVTLEDVENGLVASGWSYPEARPTVESARKELLAPAPSHRDDDADTRAAPSERLLIQEGAMVLEVPRFDEASGAFQARIAEWGGYLSSRTDATLTARLPAERFAAAWEWLRSLGRVTHEQVRSTEVTEEYRDLAIRLENATKSRERLLALLDKAEKVEDILKIEEQLRRLTEEIERMEGRRKFLADQVAMATLTVTFEPVRALFTAQRPSQFGWIRTVGAELLLGDW